MKKVIVSTGIGFILIFGMGSCVDSDQVNSGKINACKAKHIKEMLIEDPDNEELIKEVSNLERYIKINRELSGDVDAFDKAIEKHLLDCE